MNKLVLLSVMLLSNFAFADSVTIEAKINAKGTQGYVVVPTDEKDTVKYQQSTSNVLVRGEMSNGEVTEETNTDVPGVNKPGYSRISIKKKDEARVVVTIETEIYVKEKYKITQKEKYDAALTRGTWTDLQNGQDVELKLTDKADAKSKAYMQKILSTEMKAVMEQELKAVFLFAYRKCGDLIFR